MKRRDVESGSDAATSAVEEKRRYSSERAATGNWQAAEGDALAVTSKGSATRLASISLISCATALPSMIQYGALHSNTQSGKKVQAEKPKSATTPPPHSH
jgi:hypothetical protein